MRFLLTLAVAAWSLVAATAQTSQFPNINVRTNATVRDLTVTSTNWSLPMPSSGLLGGTAGGVVGVKTNVDLSGLSFTTNGTKPKIGSAPINGSQWVLNTFRSGGALIILREDWSPTQDAYWLGYSVNDASSIYAMYELRKLSTSGPHALQSAHLRVGCKILDQTNGMTFTGAGWVTNVSQANSFGTSYARTTATGDSFTWVAPTSTSVGLRIVLLSNHGFGLVSIDGSTTAANQLLTAQQYVDLGLLASTALVANGGTLNPTDRLVNCFKSSAAQDFDVGLATNLTAATHTIVVSNTGYKPAASSGSRISVTAGFSRNGSSYSLANADAYPCVVDAADRPNDDIGSAWEFALQIKPTNATSFTFVGSIHGNEIENSFAIKTNGTETTLDNFQYLRPTRSVYAVRTSSLRHPDIGSGATDVGLAGVSYLVTPFSSLTVSFTITNLYAGACNNGYLGMMPMGNLMDRATTVGYTADAVITNSNGSVNAPSKCDSAYLWNSSGTSAAAVFFPDIGSSANFWVTSYPYFLWVEDRAGGVIKKVYLNAFLNDAYYEAGSTWRGLSRYMIQVFPSGANAALARQ